MNVVGLDLSLSATGVANGAGVHTIKVKTTGMERLAEVRDAVIRATHVTDQGSGPLCYVCQAKEGERWSGRRAVTAPIYGGHPDLVVIEGYSMGPQRGSQGVAQALGELGGVVRLVLWEAHLPFVDVSPASLKKYATGKGNANKDAVLIAAVKRDAPVGDNNQADAWWLRAMGMDALGQPVVEMPKLNRTALAAVAWPRLVTA